MFRFQSHIHQLPIGSAKRKRGNVCMRANILDATRLARQPENRSGLELIEAFRFLQEQSIKGETWIGVNYVPVGMPASVTYAKT